MKLLEYEAKKILADYTIPVPRAQLVTCNHTPNIEPPVVLKSQVPVGGRGKAGGVVKISDKQNVAAECDRIFHLAIKDYTPKTILAEEVITIQNEYYLSLFIDRVDATIKLMAHINGGVEVEENSKDTFLITEITAKNTDIVGEKLAEYYELPGQTFALQELVKNLYSCFIESDVVLLEINPLILTTANNIVAGDCKMELDDAALFRHPEWQFEETENNSNFVTLDPKGTVATIANGAGLAMATVDAVTAAGLRTTNFLDIGGGANTASVLAAFEKIMKFPHVEAVVINIFAGITRCDEVALAIISARKQIDSLPPLFIRLAGTNFEKAVTLLTQENIPTLATLEACLDAVQKGAHE